MSSAGSPRPQCATTLHPTRSSELARHRHTMSHFNQGTPAGETMKEKLIKIDNENYIKEAEVIEGGVLDHGFQKYVARIEVIGKTDDSSVLRSTIEFEAEDESKASSVSTSALAAIAEAVSKYMKEQRSGEQAPKPTSDEEIVQPK